MAQTQSLFRSQNYPKLLFWAVFLYKTTKKHPCTYYRKDTKKRKTTQKNMDNGANRSNKWHNHLGLAPKNKIWPKKGHKKGQTKGPTNQRKIATTNKRKKTTQPSMHTNTSRIFGEAHTITQHGI